MIIKPKHKHVDSNGMCYLPYLSSWNPNNCNLVGLVSTISKTFSPDPPVRSQPATTTPQPSPSPYPTQPTPQPYPTTQPSPYPYTNNPQYPPPPQYTQPPPQPQYNSHPYEDPSLVAKRNAVNSATERSQTRLQQFYQATTKEIDDFIAKNSELEGRMAAIDQEKMRLSTDKGQIDVDIDGMTKSFEDIAKWLEMNDTTGTIDIDAVTEPKDPLQKQLLFLVAEDATIEDALYYLEKKLNSGSLDVDTYLKSVRSLSAEQFLKRATIKKVHEKQRGGR